MPKAANPFDYRTIADVLIAIDYTALHSFTYQTQLLPALNQVTSGDRPFSFRHQFADQWYDLHNPDQTDRPMTVRWRTTRQDFPPNLQNLGIQHVVLYFARAEDASFEVPVTHLHLSEQDGSGFVGGGATTLDGVISTRTGSAGSWMAMKGKAPIGEWELALPNTQEIRRRFKDNDIEDIVFVITYAGRAPAWPT
jgi:hypothetical protein